MFVASKCSTVSVAVFVAVAPHWVPILCSLQTHLWPLPVQTQGMQLLKLFIQVYYNNSHQQYENVTIEVSHSSMFKNHSSCKSYYVQNRTFKTVSHNQDIKTAGAVILQLALLPCP